MLDPGPGGDVSGVAGGGAKLDRGVVPEGHGEDVGGAAACSLFGRPGGEPTLDVEGVGGGDGIAAGSGGGSLQAAEGVVIESTLVLILYKAGPERAQADRNRK